MKTAVHLFFNGMLPSTANFENVGEFTTLAHPIELRVVQGQNSSLDRSRQVPDDTLDGRDQERFVAIRGAESPDWTMLFDECNPGYSFWP